MLGKDLSCLMVSTDAGLINLYQENPEKVLAKAIYLRVVLSRHITISSKK